MNLNKQFWENRYKEERTGWDIGTISTPLKAFIDQLEITQLKILIPGAGYGHEALYLRSKGFKNVTVIDLAEQPLQHLKKSGYPPTHLKQGNFFDLDKKDYDLILEQTFFCALNPKLRSKYVLKMYDLLNDRGKLVGLFFNVEFEKDGPPFGGSKIEYELLFKDFFDLRVLETAYNSISPRANKELFFIFEKRKQN
ncbi:methyltransferase domain-containing protein [Croceivirga radicis]|uniref:methyltransferase domain-containing protein n=1 Tax=Croceivirga radicis TaxID=1929488 RepID=UPI000255B450|nr:methyltransferase domain-containing protein [Croceivirga radicis]